MDITKLVNVKPVEDFVSYIRNRIESANRNWIEIAQAFAEAKDMYGNGSKNFKDLCERTNFSQSKIAKLLAIVSSDRLKKYAVQLSSVHSWGTLYAIASLTDEQFNQFREHYKLDDPATVAPFISQEDVAKLRKGPMQQSVFRSYSVIQIDDEAVKGGLLSGAEFEELERLLAKIEQMSSYVKVKRSEIEEKQEISRMNLIFEKVKQVTRRHYLEAINAIKERRKKQKGETKYDFVVRCFGKNEAELMADLQVDPKTAFEAIGAQYDMASFYNEAEAEVNNAEKVRMSKYAQKVLSRPININASSRNETDETDYLEKRSLKKREAHEASKEKLRAMFGKAA